MEEATRKTEYTTETSLYLAFEPADKKWKLGFSTGLKVMSSRIGFLEALSQLEQHYERFADPDRGRFG